MKKATLIYLFAIVAIFTVSCKKSTSHVVMYSLQGSSMSKVTYTDQNGSVQKVDNVNGQWTTSFSTTDHGAVFTLTVESIDGSNVGGKIFIDNKETAASNGSASKLAISATLP